MRHTLIIERATPSPQFNAFEGEVEGRLDGHHVRAFVYLTLESWDDLKPGDEREVWARFVRYGAVSVVAPDAPAVLTHDEVVGTVRARDDEELKVDSVLSLDVELDLPTQADVADVGPGDRIRVEGRLEVDFDPDDYEDD